MSEIFPNPKSRYNANGFNDAGFSRTSFVILADARFGGLCWSVASVKGYRVDVLFRFLLS